MEEQVPKNFENSEQKHLIGFIDEYNNSDNVKKASLLINSLKSDEQSIRLYCAKKLSELGNILGLKRIEEELIPFITDLILNYETDSDVLCEFSNQIINLLMQLKHNEVYGFLGIRSLEILAGNDDELVRKNAIINLSKLIELLDEDLINNEIFPLMKRLIENDLKTKMSCCYLFPVVYPKLQSLEIKKELLQVYYEISHDESPSVRRAAADNIKLFCKVDDQEVINLLIKLYNDFISDTVDIVKIFTINSTEKLLAKINDKQKDDLLLNLTKKMAQENSWRVKFTTTECIAKICKNFTCEFFNSKFVPLLLLFLNDKEPEVKCSVLTYFDTFFEYLSVEKFQTSFFPIFKNIYKDQNLHVRSVFANCILKCIPFLRKDENVLNLVTPLIKQLLQDDIVEVQYSAIENIDKLISIAKDDDEFINKYIMTIVNEGMNKKKWRFRYLIVENLLKAIKQINYETIKKHFMNIIISLLYDHAEEIRITAWKVVEEIENNLKQGFIENEILNIQKEKLKSINYLFRISTMKSIDYLKNYYKKETLINNIIPLIIDTAKNDKVPNVKFSSCEVLTSLVKFLNKEIYSKNIVENYIKSLFNDSDEDVIFFSKKAFNELQK